MPLIRRRVLIRRLVPRIEEEAGTVQRAGLQRALTGR
jgi:hypothetical protein